MSDNKDSKEELNGYSSKQGRDCEDTVPVGYVGQRKGKGKGETENGISDDIPDEDYTNVQSPQLSPKGAAQQEEVARHVSHVMLRCKGLQSLPPNLALPYMVVRIVDLRENQLTTVPEELFRLQNLSNLRLDNNRLSEIPTGILRLGHLQLLTLSYNHIKRFEVKCEKASQLLTLSLNNNKLEFWSEASCTLLSSLQVLHLHNNPKLPALPFTFGQMNQLVEFSFDWYLYLHPTSSCTLKGIHGVRLIHDTRQACKQLELKNIITNVSRKKKSLVPIERTHCTCVDFLNWFSEAGNNGYLSYVYGKQRNTLHIAAIWGHMAVVKDLLDVGMDPNAQDEEGATPLLLALQCNKIEVVQLLLAREDINIGLKCKKYGTALHMALIKGHFIISEQLLSRRSVVADAKDNNGNTALHYILASFNENIELAGKLAHTLAEKFRCKLNEVNNNNLTPLHCAAKKNQTAAIKFALQYNQLHPFDAERQYNFNLQGGKYGFTPLHYLVVYGDIELVHYCLQRFAIDAMSRDYSGRTPRDLVRNTAVARVLYRHEKLAIRKALQKRTREGSRGCYDDTSRFYTDLDIEVGKADEAALATSRAGEDLGDDIEEDIAIPIQIQSQSYATPRKRGAGSREIAPRSVSKDEAKSHCLGTKDAYGIPCTMDVRAHNHNKSFNVPPDSMGVLLRLETIQRPFLGSPGAQELKGPTDIWAVADEGRPSSLDCSVSAIASQFSVMHSHNSHHSHNTSSQSSPPHQSLHPRPRPRPRPPLKENIYTQLYKRTIAQSPGRYREYHIVYHLFSRNTNETYKTLVLLHNNYAHKTIPTLDTAYLLGIIKGHAALAALERTPKEHIAVATMHELSNAIMLAKPATRCLPPRPPSSGQSAQPRHRLHSRSMMAPPPGFVQQRSLGQQHAAHKSEAHPLNAVRMVQATKPSPI